MSEQQVLPEVWIRMLKHAADEAMVMWEDFDWPKDELLALPPFYVTRKFIAQASPENILKLLASLAQSEAERERLKEELRIANLEIEAKNSYRDRVSILEEAIHWVLNATRTYKYQWRQVLYDKAFKKNKLERSPSNSPGGDFPPHPKLQGGDYRPHYRQRETDAFIGSLEGRHAKEVILHTVTKFELAREMELNQGLRQAVKEYRRTHSIGHYAYYPCELCRRSDAILAPPTDPKPNAEEEK